MSGVSFRSGLHAMAKAAEWIPKAKLFTRSAVISVRHVAHLSGVRVDVPEPSRRTPVNDRIELFRGCRAKPCTFAAAVIR
jgi:hypothetical protein